MNANHPDAAPYWSTSASLPQSRLTEDTETGVPAYARLAGIPVDRIVNCWPLERLLAWLADSSSECRR